METTQNKLHLLISKVFGVPVEKISDESSPDNIETWDSLSHLNLIVSIEAQFGIGLSPEEAMEMQSVKLIRMTLADHGIDV